jgi:hypothetical protein
MGLLRFLRGFSASSKPIQVMDRVQIITVVQGETPGLLHQSGQVVLITDDTIGLVQLDSGEVVPIDLARLRRI